jgi:hypothetical protein
MALPVRIIVLGDDSYTITTEAIANKLGTVYNDLGIISKFKVLETYEATFCSSIFVPASNGSILTMAPGRAFVKLFASIKKYNSHKAKKYARGIAECVINDFYHIPFMRAFCESVIRNTDGLKGMKDHHKYRMHSANTMHPTAETYDFLLKRYGITKSVSDGLVRLFEGADSFNYAINSPWVDKMVEVDCELFRMGDNFDDLRDFDVC